MIFVDPAFGVAPPFIVLFKTDKISPPVVFWAVAVNGVDAVLWDNLYPLMTLIKSYGLPEATISCMEANMLSTIL